MSELVQRLHPVLSIAAVYRFLMRALGGHNSRTTFIREYVRPEAGMKILDIGCGPGDITNYLPGVDYTGIDLDAAYIEYAKKHFGHRGRFMQLDAAQLDAAEFGQYDIILTIGLLHHLSDDEVKSLLAFAQRVLKPTGRLVTFDGCYLEKGQHLFDRWMLSRDRGRYVRYQKQYQQLAEAVFPKVICHSRSDLLRIPYTLLMMECSFAAVNPD